MTAEISGILCCPEYRKEGWISGNHLKPRELLYKNNYCCTRAILGYFLVLIFTLNEKIPEAKADTGAKVFCLLSMPCWSRVSWWHREGDL